MGADRPGAGAALRLRALSLKVKAPPGRLYGRARGHALRARQVWLLEHLLPRLRAAPAEPFAGWAGPRWLEVGFGGGEHALATIAAHPEAMLVACEVFENGICSLLSKLAPLEGAPPSPTLRSAPPSPGREEDRSFSLPLAGRIGVGGNTEAGAEVPPLPPNLRLWDDDARLLLRALPDARLDRLFLLFPDPWPKTRHAKRRFVHPGMLPEVARVLRPGGEWRIASDDPTYQTWVAEVLAGQALFDAPPPAALRPTDWPPTRYEAKAVKAGRKPLYWTIRRGSQAN